MPIVRTTPCPLCGMFTYGEMCAHHGAGAGDNWAQGNKAMCDFFHRGKVAKRKPMSPDELWLYQIEGLNWQDMVHGI